MRAFARNVKKYSCIPIGVFIGSVIWHKYIATDFHHFPHYIVLGIIILVLWLIAMGFLAFNEAVRKRFRG